MKSNNPDDQQEMNGNQTVSTVNILKSSSEIPELHLPSLRREDTFGIETLTLTDPENNKGGFNTSRAKFDNFVMETVRENTDTKFEKSLNHTV